MDYKVRCAAFLAENLNLDETVVLGLLEQPPKEDMGDFALPCFRFAKELRKAPAQIASDFVMQLTTAAPFIDQVKATGPYVNIFLSKGDYCGELVHQVNLERELFAAGTEGKGKTCLVEFSSPNIAKPFHVGHAFSTFLGDAISRMFAHRGFTVERLNHLGDYGTQFGKLIVAFRRWGDETALAEDAIKELLRVYVRFHQEAESQPSLEDEARACFKALEEGEPAALALWERFRALSLEEFDRLYKRLDVRFDSYNGESFYSDKMAAVVKDLEDKGLLEESRGAKIVNLEELKMPPCLVLKSDGSTIYATRDLAAARYRYDHYHFDRLVYVVGLPQSLHFQQVFAVLKKAGFAWAEDMIHVGFGLVKFPGEVILSTRSGDVVYLEDLLNEAVSKTREIIINNNSTREDKMSDEEVDETANTIGLAAIRYTFLRSGRERDIIFRWDEILDFEGDSAPYMLYAYARARSILRRSGVCEETLRQTVPSGLSSDSEFQLCREIDRLRPMLQQALDNYEPSIFARQIMTMCRSFSRFYNQMPILQAEEASLKKDRLSLCLAFSEALKTSLGIMGINTVERM